MKLIVGLGNPGRRYTGTRHNIGFEILGELARRLGETRPRAKFEGELIEGRLGDNRIALLCPLTFMNLSGRSVKAATTFYDIPVENVLIVCDDFNLDLGRLRLRKGGSSGGQNGLADIIEKLNTRDVNRLRVGIGKPPARWNPADFVLSKFNSDEKEMVQEMKSKAADAAWCWVENGIETAMNRFNSSPEKTEQKNKKKQSDSDSQPEGSSGTKIENVDDQTISKKIVESKTHDQLNGHQINGDKESEIG